MQHDALDAVSAQYFLRRYPTARGAGGHGGPSLFPLQYKGGALTLLPSFPSLTLVLPVARWWRAMGTHGRLVFRVYTGIAIRIAIGLTMALLARFPRQPDRTVFHRVYAIVKGAVALVLRFLASGLHAATFKVWEPRESVFWPADPDVPMREVFARLSRGVTVPDALMITVLTIAMSTVAG